MKNTLGHQKQLSDTTELASPGVYVMYEFLS